MILLFSKYQSFLPDYAVFLFHFYNDSELGLLFQSISHSFRSSSSLLLPMTQRSHIEHSQMTMIPIYQSYPNDGLNYDLFNIDRKLIASNNQEDWI